MLGDVHQGLLNKMHCSIKERTNHKHKRKLIKAGEKERIKHFYFQERKKYSQEHILNVSNISYLVQFHIDG